MAQLNNLGGIGPAPVGGDRRSVLAGERNETVEGAGGPSGGLVDVPQRPLIMEDDDDDDDDDVAPAPDGTLLASTPARPL